MGFGGKVLVLNKPGLEYDEESLSVFQEEEEAILPTVETGQEMLGQAVIQYQTEDNLGAESVLHFEGSEAVVFDTGTSDGTVVMPGEMGMENSTIFFLPNIVGEDQLEEVL